MISSHNPRHFRSILHRTPTRGVARSCSRLIGGHLERLESRQMLATYTLSDYLPINSTDTWSYSGTAGDEVNGSTSATASLHYSLLQSGLTAETFTVNTSGFPG